MKKVFLPMLLCYTFAAFSQPQKAVIKGKLEQIREPVSYIYYRYANDSGSVTDSTRVVKGNYAFAVTEEMPLFIDIRSLPFDDQSKKWKSVQARILVQQGINTLISRDSFPNMATPDVMANIEYQKLENSAEPVSRKIDTLNMQIRFARQNKDSAAMIAAQVQAAKMLRTWKDVYGRYAEQHPQSPVALYALMQFAGNIIEAEKTAPLFNRLPEAVRNSKAGGLFEKKISTAAKVSAGAAAPGFSLPDTTGNPVSLAGLSGKYILLDFWASWCLPCRLSNPQLVAVYHKYKGKHFEIAGISLDKTDGKEKWIAAIRQDGLSWIHLSDLKGFNSPVARLYDVHEIPQNFLIDPNGTIIARNLEPDELESRLARLLK